MATSTLVPAISSEDPDQDGPTSAVELQKPTEAQANARKEQQKRVFDRIWSEVEKIMDEVKARLVTGLENASGKDVDSIEKDIK